MKLRLVILGCLLMAACLPAAPAPLLKLDSLTVGSNTYTNVTVIGATTTDLIFTHDRCFGNVKLKYLPPALQKQFHYDAKAAAEAERKQIEDDLHYQQTVAANAALRASQRPAAPQQRGVNTSEQSLADPVSDQSLLGKPAPALETEKWLGEKPELEGKFVLITFWAPWSIPCQKCIPDLNALQKRFAGKLAVVALASESEAEVTDPSAPRIEFASAIDTQARLSHALGVTSVPCALLVDPKGIIRYQGHPAAITPPRLEALMAKTAD